MSILKRQTTQSAGPPPTLYPLEDDDDSQGVDITPLQTQVKATKPASPIVPPALAKKEAVPAPVPAPALVLALAPEITSLQADLKASQKAVSDLQAEVDLIKASTATELKALKGSDTQFFGLVEGGLNGRALLFDALPKEMIAEKASAKADKDAWVKLSHPQVRTERKLANGSTVVDMWLRAHAICPRTSDVNPFWVRERAEDDTPTFKKFAWYPTP